MLAHTYINAVDEKNLKRLVHKHLSGKVLDVGCGHGRVKQYLRSGSLYVGMDTQAGPYVDVIGDVHQLPFTDAEFDSVICTAVLEHVQDENKVIAEIYRVLKPGGKALLTIPFIQHYHKDPEDYRRLSHIGLPHLLTKHGFSNITTHLNYGVYTVIEYTFFCALVNARNERLLQTHWYLLPHYLLIGFFMLFFRLLNYLISFFQKHDTSMYVGVLAIGQK